MMRWALVLTALATPALGATQSNTDVFEAARRGDSAAIARLRPSATEVNRGRADEQELTPLMIAAVGGHLAALKTLLALGADARGATPTGWTPLMAAAESGSEPILVELLERGADVNARTENGYTALMKAVAHGHPPAASFLIARGARINDQTDSGLSPLILAAWEGRTAIAAILLKHGADTTQLYRGAETAFAIATKRGHREVARQIAAAGGK